jgi:hypothetical protein
MANRALALSLATCFAVACSPLAIRHSPFAIRVTVKLPLTIHRAILAEVGFLFGWTARYRR